MSGFEEHELMGQPHYILRHPDMPPAAFAGLWETLAKHEKWHGYVKNLRKDGGFYFFPGIILVFPDRIVVAKIYYFSFRPYVFSDNDVFVINYVFKGGSDPTCGCFD